MAKSSTSSYNSFGPMKSAEPIVKHISSGKTASVDKPRDPPESFLKGVSNTGGNVPMSRVFNEVK